MRPLIWVILACLLVARVHVPPLDAVRAQTPVVRFEPASTEIEVGQETEIQIYIDDVDVLLGIDLRFEFTPGLVQVIDVDGSTAGIQVEPGSHPYPDYVARNEVDNVEGVGLYTIVQLTVQDPAIGSGVIATIRMLGVEPGTCLLEIPFVRAVMSETVDLSANVQGGEVVVWEDDDTLVAPSPLPPATDASPSAYPELELSTPVATSDQPEAYPPATPQPPPPMQTEVTQVPGIVAAEPTVPPADRPASLPSPTSPTPPAQAPTVGDAGSPPVAAPVPGAGEPGSPARPLPQAPGAGEAGLGSQRQTFLIPTFEPLATPRPSVERPEPFIARELFVCMVVTLAAISLLLTLYLIRHPGRPSAGT
ncbi:MAG: hypothetical protein JXA74_03110 [Anaerolineae bacterium]|nr:hypothetical protein [Anaerolineae bacterium]